MNTVTHLNSLAKHLIEQAKSSKKSVYHEDPNAWAEGALLLMSDVLRIEMIKEINRDLENKNV